MSGAEIATLEAEVKEYKLQLETIQLGLQGDPDNTELQALKQEIEEVITLTETAISELKPASASASTSASTATTAVNEKWSKDNHPAYQTGGYHGRSHSKPEATAEHVEETTNTPVSFSVNDTVSARWKSGDGGFYTARITSITGSKHDPVYLVKFQKYGTTETLKGKDIKPLQSADARKRKADNISGSGTGAVAGAGTGSGSGSGTSTPTTANFQTPGPASASASATTNPSVISAAASVDTSLMNQVKREPSKVSDGPIRPAKIPRKVKANKELEAGKAKWQDFASKGKFGKASFGKKKESMFRTGDSFTARVGFTGSGQEMRKDPTRSRNIYQRDGDE